jgi:type IV pilus assembly protein PilO
MALFGMQRPTPVLAIILAGIAAYIGYSGDAISSLGISGVKQQNEKVGQMQQEIALLEAQTDTARRELARGTMEDLRQRLEGYRASLELMRRLVPERNEVPNLLDDISSRARIRGVTLSQIAPLPDEAGPPPFETKKYQISVLGRYDQVGEFLADVASLQRIIVPSNLSVRPAALTAARALGDTTGALLEAKFQIKTYVKTPNSEEGASGA